MQGKGSLGDDAKQGSSLRESHGWLRPKGPVTPGEASSALHNGPCQTESGASWSLVTRRLSAPSPGGASAGETQLPGPVALKALREAPTRGSSLPRSHVEGTAQQCSAALGALKGLFA